MTENNDLLNKWSLIIESHNDCLKKFLASCHSICEEYIKSKKIDLVEKFNVFTIKDFEKKADTQNQVYKHFDFKDEPGLYGCINSILVSLTAMKKNERV